MSMWTNIFGVKKASTTQNKERLPSNFKWFLKSSVFSVHSVPQVLYKLPQRAKLEKFEDALLCQSPLVCKMKHLWTTYILTLLWTGSFFSSFILWQGNVFTKPSDQKSSLLTLTANGWLYRLSAETGEVLQKIYLSSNVKFRCVDFGIKNGQL